MFFHSKVSQAGWRCFSPAFEDDIHTSCYFRKISLFLLVEQCHICFVKLSIFSKLINAHQNTQQDFACQKLLSISKSLHCNRQARNHCSVLKNGMLHRNKSMWSEMKKGMFCGLKHHETVKQKKYFIKVILLTYNKWSYRVSCAPSSNSHNAFLKCIFMIKYHM